MDSPFPLNDSYARNFAGEWVDAWNSHDPERIMAHYSEDVELTSPVALKLLDGDGTVRGLSSLREYFKLGLQAYPDLRFDLINVLCGIETIVIVYSNNFRKNKTAEVMLLNEAGKICRVWANYGD